MSDVTGSANAPLATLVTPTASVAGMSDSDAQTPVIFTKRMQKDLENRILAVDEDRGNINRKFAELLTSAALDSAMPHGLPELNDSKLASHHKRLTRLVEENDDDLIVEVSSFMDERLQANAGSAPALVPAELH